jgi:hypothetical protein
MAYCQVETFLTVSYRSKAKLTAVAPIFTMERVKLTRFTAWTFFNVGIVFGVLYTQQNFIYY